MKNTPHEDTVRRAALPEVMFAPDIAIAVQLPIEVVEARAPDGSFGPCFYVEGRVAVLRDGFLESLARRASAWGASNKEILS